MQCRQESRDRAIVNLLKIIAFLLQTGATDNIQPTYAVVTVPANFNEAQRKAMKEACEIAYIEVMCILDEPMAAAIAYDAHNDVAQNILVFRMGATSTDASIITVDDNGHVKIISSADDAYVGGDDIDGKMLQHFLQVQITLMKCYR